MAGHHKWSDLVAQMSPESRARAERKADALRTAMDLDELRKARNLTQEELAERLNTRQSHVSQTLRRADVRVSTLHQVIAALGGELVITARFPDGEPAEVRITQFDAA